MSRKANLRGRGPRHEVVRGMRRGRSYRGPSPVHASKLEDTVIQNLKDRGVAFEYEPETFTYSRPIRGAKCDTCGGNGASVVRRYTPDLRIGNVYVEIKGKLDSDTRSKMEDFVSGSPGIDLRFLFQRDNWLTGKHKHKNSDWAKKLGVKYHVGTEVPQEWIDSVNAAG